MARFLDRLGAAAAARLMTWLASRVDPSRREWIEAIGAEFDAIIGGWRKLAWVAGGLLLAWSFSSR